MPHFSVTDLDYQQDSSIYFEAVRDLPNAVWLDSGRPYSLLGRYDIISAAPSTLLKTVAGSTEITRHGDRHCSTDDPFDLVAEYLAPYKTLASKDLPFCGGALGYFGYDLGRRLETLPATASDDVALPDMLIGMYDWAIVQDHHQQHAWLFCLPSCKGSVKSDLERRCKENKRIAPDSRENSFIFNGFNAELKVDTYKRAIEDIQRYITAGDCYQVNFTQRHSASYSGDTYQAYQLLRTVLPSPHSAYMAMDEGSILSLSPERFLHVAGRQVETKPIKGTLPRKEDPQLDIQNGLRLQQSQKDRAENLMIVDLLRNDLSKNCELGSVRVPELFALESFPNVHHLVSTITGTLNEDKSALDLLKGCFPGGSITGAPKLRAMEIIEELEPCRRSVYCGSLGYISANGNMDTNIAIRTLVCDKEQIHCWGGGGIVADSVAEAEYQESLDKVSVILETLNKMGQRQES